MVPEKLPHISFRFATVEFVKVIIPQPNALKNALVSKTGYQLCIYNKMVTMRRF